MIKFTPDIHKALIELQRAKNITLEGNIIRVIDHDGDEDFAKYLEESLAKDKEIRRRRLEITKQIQEKNRELTDLNAENQRIMDELQDSVKSMQDQRDQIEIQNRELVAWKEDNERISIELRDAMLESERAKEAAERAKEAAETDLDMMQKKTQFELIGVIVKVALFVIIGVGVTTTALYVVAMFSGTDTQIIGSTWSNMFGILLTNAFSIIGTIMGVKYASEKQS